MGWLLVASLLVSGLLLLAVLLVRLVGPLRRVQSARGSLRSAVDTGAERMRVGVAALTSWVASRRGGGVHGPDA